MFRLLRYFSITSLIAFVIVIALLGSFYRKTALRDLIESEENKNVALTQAFSNSLWPQFAPFVTSVSGLRGEELRALPETARLRQAVVAQMDGLSVVKVKIYNLEGLTVFSTEASQIGEDKSTNAGYLSARSGNVASELTHRDTFSAFESTIEDRDVLSSYVPIQPGGPTGPVEGVFELYTDVTSLLERIKLTERNVVVEVSLILSSLYAVLFFLVRHADNVIRRQHIERNRAEAALQRARDELEKIVAERTAQLRTISDDLRLELVEREQADEALRQSEERYRSIFETAAVAIWEEDFSEIKAALDELRAQGVTDFAGYLDEHPEFIPQAAQMVKVQDVNDTTLKMLGARSKSELLGSLEKVFVPETLEIFREEMIAIFEGGTYFEGETINLTLQGEPLNLWLTMTIPTEREKFDSVLVSTIDITDRKRSQEALQESEARKAAILEAGLDCIITIDHEGKIIEFNPAAERTFGYTRAEAFGKEMAGLIIPHSLREKHRRGLRHYLSTGEGPVLGKRIELPAMRADGSEFPAELAIAVIALEGPPMFTAYLRDITERKQAEEALRKSEERYRNIFQTAGVAIWEEDFSEIKAALDDLKARGVTDFPGYLEEHPEFLHQAAKMVKVRDINDTTLKMLGAGTKSELLGSLEKVFVPETLEIFREELVAIAEGETYFEGETINLTLQGEPRNVLLTMAIPAEREKFGSVLVSIMDITERKHAEAETQRRLAELEAIVKIAAALRTASTRAEMFPLVLDQAIELLNADGASISLSDPASGEIAIELGRGGGAKFTGRRIPQGAGVTGRVIASGQPYVTSDAQHDPNFLWPHLLGDLSAVACVPLITQGQTIGALWVGHTREITNDEVRLLTAIADMVANAIHRATLHEQTEQRLKRLAALRTVDTAISASLDLRVTLNVLLDQVISLLRVDAADVLLLNPHTHLLEHAAGRGFLNPAIAQARQRLGDGNAGRAALERRTLHIPLLRETRPAPTRTGLLTGEGFLAYYAVPLIAKGQVRGVLEILHRAALDPDPEWLEFLETLAGQAAIAIDNASLFDNLERTNTDIIIAYDTTLEGWARALELRDEGTEGHTRRVTDITETLARAMGMGEDELVHVRRGSLLHDIGKMGIPDRILLKLGPLSDEEWVIMRRHPVYAYELLSPIGYLRPALDIPRYHHERWDGTGYPRGLVGAEIPLAARIFAVVDVWDALRSDRPYRTGWPEEKVLDHIRQQAGKHFDPAVVEQFFAVHNDRPVPSPIG